VGEEVDEVLSESSMFMSGSSSFLRTIHAELFINHRPKFKRERTTAKSANDMLSSTYISWMFELDPNHKITIFLLGKVFNRHSS